MSKEPTLGELAAEARHAADRFTLQRQKVYAGRGDSRRLAELQRASDGATARLRAREAADEHRDEPAPDAPAS